MIRLCILTITAVLLAVNCDITAKPTTASLSVNKTVNVAALFQGDRAMADLVKQVEGGPRVPNSSGIAATRELIKRTITEQGWTARTQDFTAYSPLLKESMPGQNIFAVYPKDAVVKYIVSAHYDSRPYADMDPDPARRMEPVPGANDGASGVAILLEMSRVLPKLDLKHGVALVFFDLEDHGTAGNSEGFCLGSRYFAAHLPAEVSSFQYGINLDMVGDSELTLPMEGNSLAKAPVPTFDLWRIGSTLYPKVWSKERGPEIYDDHMPFLTSGHQFIDVIDIRYEPWHTTQDTADKCSAQSLDAVGDSVTTLMLH